MINLKKSVLRPLKQIEFPGLIIDTEKMTLALSDKKIKHVSQRCQEIFTQRKTFSLKSHKINWSAVINFTSTNKVSISSKKKTNTSFSEKWILQWPCNTGEFSQLFWRMENFVGRKIQQREPPMTIQADVLTEG